MNGSAVYQDVIQAPRAVSTFGVGPTLSSAP
eukprot:COSAG02_NODE_39535_length_416_cov_0.646688_1_plen_30_part_01